MVWNAISGTVPQFTSSGDQAIGYVIKFYDVGTLTPQAVATDSTGGTTATNFLLDSQGYVTSSGNIFIPYVESDYKIVVYLNQTDADNDATGSAVYIVDNVQGGAVASGSVGLTEMATIPDGQIIMGNATSNVYVTPSGDATVTNTGVISISNGVITESMLDTSLTSSSNIAPNSKEGAFISNGSDADHDIDITAGKVTDSTNAAYIDNTAQTIQIDVNIGTGNGGFPSGLSLSPDTWYRIFTCSKADGTDSLLAFDTSATATTARADMGTGSDYTLYRRIGWVLTDASNNIIKFDQNGDRFTWDVQVADLLAEAGSLSRVAFDITSPPDVLANIIGFAQEVGSGEYYLLITGSGQTNTEPTSSMFSLYTGGNNTARETIVSLSVKSTSSSQIYRRSTSTVTRLTLFTVGWTDNYTN